MLQIQPDKLEAFNQRVRDDNRQLSYRIRMNEKEVPLKQIMSNLTITTDGGFEEYSIGYALTSILEFTTSKELSLVGASIVDIEVGLGLDQQEVVWTSFQRFYVYDTTVEGLNRKVKCYDYMYRLANTGYFPSTNYTTTQEVCRDMSKQLNLAFTGAVNVAIDSSGLEGRTYKEVLGYLASAMGKNVRISRTNRIEFFGLSETGLSFGPGEYWTPTTNDSNYSITCLEVHYGEQSTNEDGGVTDPGYYRVGTYCSDAKTLVITNPLLKGKQDVATTVLNEIKDLSYSRFDTSYKVADYRLEVGDMVSFLINGVKIKVPILYTKYTLIYNNVNLEIQSPTKSEEKKEHNFKGTLTQKVESLHANVLQVQHVIADKVSVGELKATVAEIERLYATKAEIGELVAGSIVVEELKAQVAEIDKLVANKADINDLTTLNATIGSLKAKVAEIDTLIAGSILSEIIQSGSISSDLLNVKDGFIKDAMISSLSASKIDAGVINTNNVSIQSDNGNLLLQGNLLQFKDKNGKVRIQIGQDTKANYTFTLYDSTGQGVLINQEGIQSSNAIKDGLIVDAKISDNANISGSKLNISSLYDSMNADGSKTLKASKVYLDDKEQTLDMSFKEMTTKQDDLENSMQTAITDISVAQGQISQLIQDTTITTSGGAIKLKDAYNLTKSTVDSHSTQIGKMESTLANQADGISDLTHRVSSAEQKITDTAITDVVKQDFYTKTETDDQITSKGYQTSSQVQQTVDALQIKFSQSGGYNLLRNGSFENGSAYWVRNGNFTDGRDQWSPYGSGTSWVLWLNKAWSGFYQRFDCRVGQTYSWSMDIYVEKGTCACGIENVNQEWWDKSNGWQRMTGTFVATSTSHVFTLYTPKDGDTTIHVDNIMVCEGSIPSAYTPHPSEIYDGITQIDKDGIKVSTSKGAYTRFSADGMNSYDNNSRQTLGIRNGGMTFYAYDNNEYVGYISQSAKATGSANGVSIGISPQGEYLSLGLSSVSDPNSGFAQTSKFVVARTTNTSESMTEGLNAYAHLDMHGWNLNNVNGVNVNGGINIKGNGMIKFDSASTYASAIWEDTSSGNLAVFGDNGVVLGYKNGDTNTNVFKITEAADSKGCKINSYQHWNFNDWTMYNMQSTYNGFTRSSADSVKMFKSSSSSESNFCVQVANDYVTYFNIQANNYVDGGKYIARFHYHHGTAANIVGVHFYRALNMHGFNISNVGNMNVLGLTSEEVVANDIKITSPYAVVSRNGEVESLSIVKTTDDVTEHNDTVTVVNGRAEVCLPIGLAHMGYLVQVTPDKLVKVAVTEKFDEYFVIEVDIKEEVEVDYCIKAFQPKYQTRTAIYGELQGEESPKAVTTEEMGECDEEQYCHETMRLDAVEGDSLRII